MMWSRAIGISPEEVESDSTLWQWSKVNALVIHEYPLELERKIRQTRRAGKAGGAKRSAAKAAKARENGQQGGRPRRKIVPIRYEAGTE
jgi:hypothetical protein